MNESKKAILSMVEAQQIEVSKLLYNAPFKRQLDKYFFVYGLSLLLITSWLAGAYPGTHFITFISILTPLQVFYRTFVLFNHKSQFFLVDFCYFSTAAFLYFVNCDPTNETLFRMSYVHSNGALAVSIYAFNT